MNYDNLLSLLWGVSSISSVLPLTRSSSQEASKKRYFNKDLSTPSGVVSNAIAELGGSLSEPISIPKSNKPLLRLAWSHDVAMDLGTANTLIYIRKQGIVFNQPSIVAIDQAKNEVVAIGHKAKGMFGKTGRSISVVRPLKNGTIQDFESASLMIRHLIRLIHSGFSMKGPRLVVGVPSGISYAENRSVVDAAHRSGISSVHLAGESIAAALGAGISLTQGDARMIVDIGGGTTEVAIIIAGELVHFHTSNVAGDQFDIAIQRYIRDEHDLNIGIFEAEKLKLQIGSAYSPKIERTLNISGQDLRTGLPKQICISDAEISYAISEPIKSIIASIFSVLEESSPEVIDDIANHGVYMAGGGSLLPHLIDILSYSTGLKFFLASDPLYCVVRGVGHIVDDMRSYKRLTISQ